MQINVMRVSVILLLIGTAIGFGIGAATFSGQQTTITQRLTTTNTVTSLQQLLVTRTTTQTVLQTTSTPATTGGWREIKRFTGSASTTTEPFNVPATMWRITWTYGTSQYASFGFFVYQVGGTSYEESASSATPSGSSVTYVYKGPGDFYLKILSANVDYTISIEVPG
jgi:hypothetical protein